MAMLIVYIESVLVLIYSTTSSVRSEVRIESIVLSSY